MFKNGSGQKFAYFAFDTTTGAPKTGDAANISGYVNKDWAGAVQLTDTSATEIDSTNAKGWYLFDVSQTETNADALLFTGKSSTANISVVGQLIYTVPANFSTLSVDSSGRVDVIKIAGTTQTARDIGASVIAASVTGLTASDVGAIKTKTDSLTFTVAGMVDSNVIDWKGAAAPAMTGDAFARLGAPAGASVSADVAAIKAVLPAALVSGRIDASVGAMAAGVLTATSIAADAITDAKVASDVTIASVTGAVGSVTGAVGSVTGAVGSVTGNVGGNVTGSVGSVTGLTASNLDATVSSRLASSSYTAPPSASTIAQAVWDALTSALTTIGSIGKLLVTDIDATISSRSSYAGGDTSGTTTLLSRLTSTRAGLLDHLDADVSSRMATFSYTAPLDAAGTRSALGLASANLDTQIATLSTSASITSLQSHGDSAWATATGFSTLNAAGVRTAVGMASANLDTQIGTLATASALATVASYVDTEVAAIKAKTDNLPSDPADASDIASAFGTVNTTLATIAGYIDTEVSAIKAKTDSLTFTVSGQVDANIKYVADDQIIGNGVETTDEWRPA